ncbi:MAG: 4-alpha-glucanotransferase [Calditrichaeota bacterium]|nr:MAG: 4-alpha-glucanotransferase [Calditrichota bacterium]
MTQLHRSSGLLLHPTSLPGPYGIGTLGDMALRWIDFLASARQHVWQILPLGPTGYGNSPYQTTSTFAGNPLLIDLEWLVQEGYLDREQLANAPAFPRDHVDFDRVIEWKIPLLLTTYRRFEEIASPEEKERFHQFCRQHDQKWLDDFALFMAIKQHLGGSPWNDWPPALKLRDPAALKEVREKLREQIQAHKFLQYLFFSQWMRLRQYAHQRGVQIMGDIPIYVTYDSADVWANQELFHLDEQGNPTVVAGVPPDYFSETGQLWGNPIYNWEVMEKNRFHWWKARVRLTLACVDLIRIDHFRGFEAYWAVPFGEKTAVNGKWVKGPGERLFDSLMTGFTNLPVIVEDLGVITPEVEALRDRYGFPGMKILQFAFSGDPDNPYLPHNFDRNCVVYTGSHDNNTTRGWFASAPEEERQFCARYLGFSPRDIAWDLIRLASASTAVLTVFPVQDVLSLGAEARMNLPGHPTGNWTWRLLPDQLREEHAARLLEMVEVYGRDHLPISQEKVSEQVLSSAE